MLDLDLVFGDRLPGSWARSAACKGVDVDMHPLDDIGRHLARQVCAGCPVRSECLEHALAKGETEGVWGGLDEEERRRLRKHRARAIGGGFTHADG